MNKTQVSINTVPAGNGLLWIKEAWFLFQSAPGRWIGSFFLILIISAVAHLIPILGPILGSFLFRIVSISLFRVAFVLQTENKFDWNELFFVARERLLPIIQLVFVYISAIFLGVILVLLFVVGPTFIKLGGISNLIANPSTLITPAHAARTIVGVLVLSLFIATIDFLIFIANGLVVLHDLPAFTALKLSFCCSVKNWLPLTVWGVSLFSIACIATIPLGLVFYSMAFIFITPISFSLLLLIPISFISGYMAIRDLFILVE